MNAIQKKVLVFSAAAAGAFSALYARGALANFTVDSLASSRYTLSDKTEHANWPITGGTAVSTPGLAVVYFDFTTTSAAAKVITSVIWRKTYNGTLVLTNSAAIVNNGFHETSVSGDSLNAGRGAWDYWSAGLSAEGGTGLTPIGIGVATY